MRRASSIREIPSDRQNSRSTAGASSGSHANSRSPAREGGPHDVAELNERRLRFGDNAIELASFPEEEPLDASGAHSLAVPEVHWGGAAAQGQRRSMEDTHIGISDLESHYGRSFAPPNSRSFFGVFDGHGGVSAAEFARDELLSLVVNNASFGLRPGEALNTAFLDLDERFYEAVQDKRRTASGCTLLAALLWGSQLVIANAGDSRAVLCRRGRAMNLSRDHKPSMASEKLRITNLGGYVCEEGFLNGQLGVSRAIGDYHFEGVKHKPANGRPLAGPLTAEPEISMFTLLAEDEFLVLACDGLWDVLPSQRAIEIARACLQRNSNDPQICAQMLVDTSMQMHASDNVTVIVVCLTPNAPPKREYGGKDRVVRSFSQNGLDAISSALAQC